MKLKILNYIHQSTRNSMRNAKNTVEGGLACVVCEICAKKIEREKWKKKIEKEDRHFFQKSMKIKILNYINQSKRNSMRKAKNTVEGGLACVVCEISAKNPNHQKR